jgi:DNA polymerase V
MLQQQLLTLKAAAELLQCHPNTLRNWDRQGVLKAVRFGNRGDRRYRKADIERLMERETPVSDETIDTLYSFQATTATHIPLFSSAVPAGFPSPADDFVEDTLDLNEYIIRHPAATFFVRVSGTSMVNAGIYPNDILVVDRALETKNESIAIVVLNGELTVKRVSVRGKQLFLMPENPKYTPIEVSEDEQCEIWGMVTHVIHATK